MVDASKACESAYIEADLIRASPSKVCVITGAGEYINGKFGEKLEIPVEIDGKQKVWSPNRDTANNLRSAYGSNTINWVGKAIRLELVNKAGKWVVLGLPSQPAGAVPVIMTEKGPI
jgi:hypothetical protein